MRHVQATKYWSVSLFCVAILLQTASTSSTLKCTKSEFTTCHDILRGLPSVVLNECDVSGNGSFFSSYSIDETQQPPSITLTPLPGRNKPFVLSETYIVGYRNCNSHPSEVCYVYVERIPTTDDNIPLVNGSMELLPGESCTFFGCVLQIASDGSCTGEDILEKNVTIVATCPDPGDSVENGSVRFQWSPGYTEKHVEDTAANVSCDNGFLATYGGVSICQRNRTWSTPSLPSCARQCPEMNMGTQEGGNIELSNPDRTVNTTITVTCDKGYKGSDSTTCNDTGEWSSELPSCTLILCPEPKGRSHGDKVTYPQNYKHEFLEEGYPVGTTITVSCGWFHRGGGEMTCDANETWSSSRPSCTPNFTNVIATVAVIVIILVATVLPIICTLCCKHYMKYRNNKIRRLNLIFIMQARKESLDPTYAPIDLNTRKKISISLSIRTTEEYHRGYDDSVATTLQLYSPLNESQQLTKSYIPKVSLAQPNIMATAPYIKDTSEVPAKAGEMNKSCPSLQQYFECETTGSGTVKPSKSVEEHSDIVFHFTDISSASADEDGQHHTTNHSGINFDFPGSLPSGAYPATSDTSGYEPYPERSTESASTSDTEISDDEVLPPDGAEPPDSTPAPIEREAGTAAPLSESYYANSSGNDDSLSPVSPHTPSDVTLAFSTVDRPEEPTEPREVPTSGPAYQLGCGSSYTSNSGYINSCHSSSGYTMESTSRYVDESNPHYTTESSLGKSSSGHIVESGLGKSSSGYVAESSLGKSSSGYIVESSLGNSSSGYLCDSNISCAGDLCSSYTSPGYLHTSRPAYISESDLYNSTVRSTIFGSLPKNPCESPALPGRLQPPTDQGTSFVGHFSHMNSGTPGYIILGEPDTSSTA